MKRKSMVDKWIVYEGNKAPNYGFNALYVGRVIEETEKTVKVVDGIAGGHYTSDIKTVLKSKVLKFIPVSNVRSFRKHMEETCSDYESKRESLFLEYRSLRDSFAVRK